VERIRGRSPAHRRRPITVLLWGRRKDCTFPP
jgi:hypothetical protein